MDTTKREAETVARLEKNFSGKFGEGGDIRVYFAPGRVNLIGEHTDYNGGASLPVALDVGTYFVVRERPDRTLRFFSENFPDEGIIEGSLDDLTWSKEASWTNYPKGVMWAFEKDGHGIPHGFDILVWGNIPNGSGLSSSASVEVGTGIMLKDMTGADVDLEEIARIGQYAENNFNGVNCGILDQMAIAMGAPGQALYLRTAPFAYEHVPLDLGDARIVVASSNKKRGLGDSKYNERRAECEEALGELQQETSISSLGDLSNEEFAAHEQAIASPVRRRRARHAVSENQRTLEACSALRDGDLGKFGELMNASHVSLRDDYEVTGPELDTLVESAWEQPGVIGARMTGAGFGGCTVNIVREQDIPAFIENVGSKYLDTIGYAADFFTVNTGEGPRRLK
ncbi:MAG: galactokinase [Clostridia bacterium]|nr:galactokinase [Clostridia bacterium]